MKRVSVFGSTGSVGVQTLELIAAAPEAFEIAVLTGGRNVALLAEQALTFGAQTAVIADEALTQDLRDALSGSGIEAIGGRQALTEAAGRPVDWVMSAVVGFAGLEISLASAKSTSVLALANKESLVCGAGLLPTACAGHDTTLLPVDSEHSAIFQLLLGEDRDAVERVILTASGGPFRNMSLKDMAKVTPEQAAAHPNWDMGQRISIDSASMFNKAMELIEAKEMFGFRPDQLEVLVHPQSLIHSLVGYRDGALVAHVGPPDMKAAIGYALNWPERAELPIERLDLGRIGRMEFHHPDLARFPAISLAFEAMRIGGAAGAVFNAAKEASLDLFLQRRIGFLDMADYTERALATFSNTVSCLDISFENVARTDKEVRRYINKLV